MQIRLAKESDVTVLVQLDKEVNLTAWSKQEYLECLKNKNQAIYIAIASGKIIACVVYSKVLEEAEILQFWVSKDSQGRGAGKQILGQLLCELSHKYRVERVFLEVRDGNIAAIKVYQSLGFIEVARRGGYYKVDGWQFDALVMLKQLKLFESI